MYFLPICLLFSLKLGFHSSSAFLQNEGQSESRGIFQALNFFNHCDPPSDLPPSIPITQAVLKDPLRKLPDKLIWKVQPKNPSQAVILANWAYTNDYNLYSIHLFKSAAMSSSLFWSSKVRHESNCSRVLLLDGTKHLTKMKMTSKNLVTVQTGTQLMSLLDFLEEKGYALPIAPIPGQKALTVGDSIAIGAYSIGVNSHKEKSIPFGSFSSLIMSFKTVAWDRDFELYSIKKLDRPDPRSLAFLTNLGRSLITEVTLLVQPKYDLRCQTFSEFSPENLFANPNSTFSLLEESFAYLVEEFGKVEVTYFPYVDRSWVKVWTKATKRPLGSLRVNKKYLSGASSPIANTASVLATKLVSTFPSLSPAISRNLFDMGVFRMRLSGANDIYGTSHDTFFNFTNDTETYNTKGYVVLTSRNEIQLVVHQFYEQFSLLRDQFKLRGKYPVVRPLVIRISTLDSPKKLKKEYVTLTPPALSVLAPVKSHPQFDLAVIFEMEFLPNDEIGEEFMSELEPWIYANYDRDYALVRPLWSSEWVHESGPFKEHRGVFKELIRTSYGQEWKNAIRILDFYDPHGVFSNPFFESLAKN